MDKQQIEAIRKRMPSYDRPGKSELLTPYGTAMQDATALLKAYDALAARLAESEATNRHRDRQLAAIVTWLEQNQPDAFRRGLWDVLPSKADSASAQENDA